MPGDQMHIDKLADKAAEVAEKLEEIQGILPEGVRLVTLVPNQRGFETFLRLDLGPRGLGHSAGLFLSAVEAGAAKEGQREEGS